MNRHHIWEASIPGNAWPAGTNRMNEENCVKGLSSTSTERVDSLTLLMVERLQGGGILVGSDRFVSANGLVVDASYCKQVPCGQAVLAAWGVSSIGERIMQKFAGANPKALSDHLTATKLTDVALQSWTMDLTDAERQSALPRPEVSLLIAGVDSLGATQVYSLESKGLFTLTPHSGVFVYAGGGWPQAQSLRRKYYGDMRGLTEDEAIRLMAVIFAHVHYLNPTISSECDLKVVGTEGIRQIPYSSVRPWQDEVFQTLERLEQLVRP